MRNKGHSITKKKTKVKLIVIGTLVVLLLASFAFFITRLQRIKGEKLENTNVNEGVKDNIQEKGVINIAVFGVDSRTQEYDNTRSDTNIVASIDFTNKTVVLTSVARDCYVDIPGHGYDKFNHAYAIGGPQLAVDTLNTNFDMDIEDYVTVNFWAVEKIIDYTGGIEVDIKTYEVSEVNKFIDELNQLSEDNHPAQHIESGKQTINGRQAVSYMRIRKVGDGDYERMERQRKVLTTALEKTKTLDSISLLSLLNQCVPYIKTSLDTAEMGHIGKSFVGTNINTFNQMQLPQRDKLRSTMINGVYYMLPDTLEDNIKEWYKKVYGIDHTLTEKTKEIDLYYKANYFE